MTLKKFILLALLSALPALADITMSIPSIPGPGAVGMGTADGVSLWIDVNDPNDNPGPHNL